MDKVGSDNAGDNCKLEFNFAALKKGNSKMVPVVMEPEVRNTKKWHGMVDFELSGVLYVDFADQNLVLILRATNISIFHCLSLV